MLSSKLSSRAKTLNRQSRRVVVRTTRAYSNAKRYAAPPFRAIKPALLRYHGPVIEQFRTISPLFVRDQRPGDLVFSIIMMVISLGLYLNIENQLTWVTGKALPSQPGFWPVIAISAMLLFSGLNIVSSIVSKREKGSWREVSFWVQTLEFAAWFVAYVYLVPKLGYLPMSVLFGAALALRIGYRGKAVLVAAIGGAVTVVLFKTFIGAQIPGGAIYNYLPSDLASVMLTYF